MSNLVCKNCCEGKSVRYSHYVKNGKCCFCGKSLITDRNLTPDTGNSLYAYPKIEDYEELVGFKVNEAFRTGWLMARTTNAQLGL